MEHYICNGGCGGVSDTPGTCQATDCSRHDQPLEECHCTDGEHDEKTAEEGAVPHEEMQ